MRPFGSPKSLERRRRRALDLLRQGLNLEQVAKRLGTTKASVCRWRQAYRRGGVAAIRAKPVPGRPRKLRRDQLGKLLDLLKIGAYAAGFPTELWTLKRVALVIRREFGVRYHPSHVWKVLRGAGWSCQVPERRAIQRDDRAIERWKRVRWPAIKKNRPRPSCPRRLPR